MICPNCRATNPASAFFCFNCQTSLTSQNNSEPFGTINNQPAWMTPGASGNSSGSDELSIEELLKSTESSFLAATSKSQSTTPAPTQPGYFAAPPVPQSPYITTQPSYSAVPQSPYTQAQPGYSAVPQSPYAPSAVPGNHGYSGAGIPAPQPQAQYRPGEYVSPPLYPPNAIAPAGAQPETWSEDGMFYFTDKYGYTSSQEFASVGQRIGGAIIDGIITLLLTGIFLFAGIMAFGAGLSKQFNGVSRGSTANFLTLTGATIMLVLFILVVVFALPFFYHVILVGISGQTLGHRIVGIEVVRTSGPGVGFGPAFLRALYGTAGSLVSNFAGETFSTIIILVVVFGMLWAGLDKNKQGWHDKIAGTYVVRVRR